MARTLRRRPLLSRLFTTYLTLVVVVMFTGIVGAVPVSFAEENDGTQVSSDTTVTAEASAEEVSPEAEDEGSGEKPEELPQAAASDEDAVAEEAPLVLEAPSDEAPMVVMTTVADGTSGLGVPPYQLEGNPDCSDVCPSGGCSEFKIDRNPANKTYSVGATGSVKIENSTGTGFDWSANGIVVYFVIVKAGPVAYVYDYSGLGGSTADTGLVSPINPNNGKRYGVSHVTFCYKVPAAKPALSLVKLATPTTYDAVGDEISYTYRLTNTGNVALFGPFPVTDDKATTSRVGVVPNPDVLAPGDYIDYEATYTITQADLDAGSVTNTARGKGCYKGNAIFSNYASQTVTAIRNPELTLLKEASPVIYGAVDDEITYTYTLTNSGNVTLYGAFTVTDDKATTSRVGVVPNPDVLAPGDDITFTATYTITQADLDAGSVTNTARGKGCYKGNAVFSNYDHETVTSVRDPELSLVKLATPTTYDEVGDIISYSYTLTNTGNVTLSGPFTVDDDKAIVTPDDPSLMILPPGASATFTASYTTTQADLDNADGVRNIARGHGFFGETPVDSNYDCETVTPVQNPALMLLKEASPATYDAVDDEITYTYTLTNSGNVTLSGPFTVEDDKATTSRVGVVPNPDVLAPGDHITFTATYTIDQGDIDDGSVTNTAMGHGYFDDEEIDSNEDDETVTAVPDPELSLVKLATPQTYDAVDDEITYTYRLTNSGNVTLMGPFSVDDDKATVTPVGMLPMVLAPDAYIDFEATYTITQADLDAGSVTNTAMGHGYYGDEEIDSNEDDETVTADQNPAIEIVKLTNGADGEYIPVGAAITWSYQVTNTGNVTITDIEVTDDIEGLIGTIDVLAPGESETLEHEGIAEEGLYENVGTAVGNPPGEGEEVVDDDDDSSYFGSTPAIDVEKSVSSSLVFAGDEVTYTFVVTNTGNVTLYDVLVDDDHLGVIAEIDELAPDASQTFTRTAVITEPTTNVVVATGTPPVGPDVSDEDEAFVDIEEFLGLPDLGVKKSADRTKADPGDTITYTVVVTNFGSAAASNYKVEDTFDQRYLVVVDAAGGIVSNGKITWTLADPLAAGSSKTITYKLMVSENMPDGTTYLDNVVVVTHPDDDNPDNNRSTWRVTVEEEPFLPFTGADLIGLLALAGVAAATGTALRRRSRKAA